VIGSTHDQPLPVRLDAVPETLLWTLYHRAVEARGAAPMLVDPMAVELVERIDYPFAERFGAGETFSQWQALRARAFDRRIARFLSSRPRGTVVALGEGLETQAWRVDNGRMQWLTVDLPEVVELRRRFLPASPRLRMVGSSVLDPEWLDRVDGAADVLVTAQGLLMYLQPVEVHGLVERIGHRFPDASLVFDAVPRWLVERSRDGAVETGSGYRPPPWSWGLDRREERRLRAIPGVRELRAVPGERGRGPVHGLLLPAASRVAPFRRLIPSIWLARFE